MCIKVNVRPLIFLMLTTSLILASCAQPATTAPVVPATEELIAEEPAPEETEAEEPTADEPVTEVPVVEKTQTPPVEERKVATFIFTQEFDTLNPYYTNMWFSQITHQLWNCYGWVFDDQNKPVPDLVREMPSIENGGLSEDGKVITFRLRDDILWSDGKPITSQDFVFTYEMIVDPANSVASVHPYDLIENIEAPDDQTVVVTFRDPFVAWAGSLWRGLLPAHILESIFNAEGTIDHADWNREPTVSCGPFIFDEWVSGSSTRFVANDNYWLGKPNIDEIFIRFVPDEATQTAALIAGDGDLGTFFSYSFMPALEKAGVKLDKIPSGYNEGWFFNLGEKGHPALKEHSVRQAIALAFDRISLTKDLLFDKTVPAVTDWDNMGFNHPSLVPYPYAPAKAKELLDYAGWVDSNGDGVRDRNGVELVLKLGTNTRKVRRDTQAIAQQQLAEIGIKLELLNYDSDVFFASYGEGGPCATGELDICEFSTSPNFPDPDSADWLCSEIPSEENPAGANWQAVCDITLDALFKLQATQLDSDERQQTFYRITRLIFVEAYWVGIWQDPDWYATSDRMTGMKFSGSTPFYNIMEWDITQ